MAILRQNFVHDGGVKWKKGVTAKLFISMGEK
jgi:hypothetical protein